MTTQTVRDQLAVVRVTLTIALAMLATVCAFAFGLARACLRACAVLLVVLLLASPVKAEDHDRSRLGIANIAAGTVSIGLSGADALITYRAVKAGKVHEANPWLVPHVKSHGIGKTMAAKFGVDVGQELALRYVEHRWPERKKTALAARVAMIGVKGWVLQHNLRVLRDAR